MIKAMSLLSFVHTCNILTTAIMKTCMLLNVEYLGNDSDTVISYARNTVSCLDHIVTTSDSASIVTGINICQDFVLYA